MKQRIFKKPDGTVIISTPTPEWQDKFDECKFPPHTEGLEYVDVQEEDVPSHVGEEEFIEQIHFDGPVAKENLKCDKEWAVCVMPAFLIKKKQEKYLKGKIAEELDKETPDLLNLVKFQNEKERLKGLSDAETYELALSNLSRAGIPKPKIEQKLQAKIFELSPKK